MQRAGHVRDVLVELALALRHIFHLPPARHGTARHAALRIPRGMLDRAHMDAHAPLHGCILMQATTHTRARRAAKWNGRCGRERDGCACLFLLRELDLQLVAALRDRLLHLLHAAVHDASSTQCKSINIYIYINIYLCAWGLPACVEGRRLGCRVVGRLDRVTNLEHVIADVLLGRAFVRNLNARNATVQQKACNRATSADNMQPQQTTCNLATLAAPGACSLRTARLRG